jgi:predicted RNase H-like HicB family nuclease
MNFLIAIHKDQGSDYGVTVPDLPGCFTAGTTFAEALSMAKEAIELHLEGMLDDGEEIPTPSTDIDEFRSNPDFADAIWALVSVNSTGNPPLPLRTLALGYPRTDSGCK